MDRWTMEDAAGARLKRNRTYIEKVDFVCAGRKYIVTARKSKGGPLNYVHTIDGSYVDTDHFDTAMARSIRQEVGKHPLAREHIENHRKALLEEALTKR